MKHKDINIQVGVKTFLFNRILNFLLLKRSKSVYGKSGGTWDLPGDRIGSRETLLDALKREIKEETGIKSFKVLGLLGVQDIFSSTDKHVVRVTYISRVTKGSVILSKEHTEYKWVSLKDTKELNLDRYVGDIIKDKNNLSFINNLLK